MTDFTIAPTTAADIPGLRRVLDGTGLFPSEMLQDMLAPALAGETGGFWLSVHHDGIAVGFCCVVPEEMAEGTWNMLALAVLPGLQSRGLGAALVAAAEARLRGQGARVLIVDTSGVEAFTRTRAFYRQNGYVEEARIRDFWGPGDDKVIFWKGF